MSAARAHAITTLRAAEAIDIRALLDVPQPDIIDLLSRVRVTLGEGPNRVRLDGHVIARALPGEKLPVRYEVRGPGFHLREVLKDQIIVLEPPTDEERARVLKLPDDRPPPMRGES